MSVQTPVAFLFFALTGALSGVARAQVEQTAADVSADAGHKPPEDSRDIAEGYALEAQLVATYSSNLYHEQRRREIDFANNGPGQRYAGMEGPDDLATGASLALGYEWDAGETSTGDTSTAQASLGAGYVMHARNSIANYFVLEAEAAYEVRRQNRVALEAGFIPRRFKKNYAASVVSGNRIYEHAHYQEFEVRPSWRHHWTKRWKTDVEYELGVRQYETPFTNRNTLRHSLELLVRRDFRRIEPGIGVGGTLASTPSGIEFGVPVDRSYRDLSVIGVLGVDLPAKWKIGLEAEYRIRRYTSDEPLNDTYFDRTDRRFSAALNLKKRVVRWLLLMAEAGFIENATGRQDHPDVDPEDLGYQEILVGLGVEASL